MWEIHKIYREKLGFYITSHMWRHTGITEYANVEKDVKIVQKQVRHDDVNTTMRYINYSRGVYEKSYKKFEEVFTKNKKETKPEPNPQELLKPDKKSKTNPETDPMVATTERKKLMQTYKEGLITTYELIDLLRRNNNRDNMYQ